MKSSDTEVVTIDLGSNSFRVLKYDSKLDKSLAECESVVSTADGLTETGNISKEAVNRIVNAINRSIKEIDYEPSCAIAVTTSAMRQANNSFEVLDYIYKKTGVWFNIIDGDEEARLTLLAMKHALKREKLDSSKFVLVDIGGGSTELIIVNDDKIFSKSFELGIITLTQSQNKDDILKKYKAKIRDFILTNHPSSMDDFPLIATAGTPTTIAAIKHGQNYETYDKNVVNGTKLSLKDLDYYLRYLNKLTKQEADILVGAGRSEFMNAGIVIFKSIYEILGKKSAIVFDDGLREGVAIDATPSKVR